MVDVDKLMAWEDYMRGFFLAVRDEAHPVTRLGNADFRAGYQDGRTAVRRAAIMAAHRAGCELPAAWQRAGNEGGGS